MQLLGGDGLHLVIHSSPMEDLLAKWIVAKFHPSLTLLHNKTDWFIKAEGARRARFGIPG